MFADDLSFHPPERQNPANRHSMQRLIRETAANAYCAIKRGSRKTPLQRGGSILRTRKGSLPARSGIARLTLPFSDLPKPILPSPHRDKCTCRDHGADAVLPSEVDTSSVGWLVLGLVWQRGGDVLYWIHEAAETGHSFCAVSNAVFTPSSVIQGHALWHLGTATMAYCLYLYYRREKIWD